MEQERDRERKARLRTSRKVCSDGTHTEAICGLLLCWRCHEPFLFCVSCEPGRLYCEACSFLASRERKSDANRTYYDSSQGREQRCDEERRRRDMSHDEQTGVDLPGDDGPASVVAETMESRREQEQGDADVPAEPGGEKDSVGDRRPGTPPGSVQESTTAIVQPAIDATKEPSGASPPCKDRLPGQGAHEGVGTSQQAEQPTARRSLEWTLVARPSLRSAARARVGTTFACPICQRMGIIARVVAPAESHRRHAHRGVG